MRWSEESAAPRWQETPRGSGPPGLRGVARVTPELEPTNELESTVSYRKDQGRYARMLAFWAVTLLMAYGIFHAGGLVSLLDRWMGDGNATLIDPFPLVGKLKLSTLVGAGLLGGICFLLHGVLNRPKLADLLIDTEAEMHKVTWPTWGEVVQGTIAVTGMVLVLFLFLTGVDLLLTKVMMLLMQGGTS
jgi:preprotein translocase SecE subunit